MADPDTGNGFVRIANTLYDAITAYPFSKRQLKVVLAVIRQTDGYGRKNDDVTVSRLASLCGLDSSDTSKALGELSRMQVVTVERGKHGKLVGLNKNYEAWASGQNTPPTGVKHPDAVRGKTPRRSGRITPKLGVKHPAQKTTPKDNPKRQPPNPRSGKRGYPDVDLPAWLPAQQWMDWCKHRLAVKKPMTDVAATRLFAELQRIAKTDGEKIQILDQSIVNGWQGVFPLRGGAKPLPTRIADKDFGKGASNIDAFLVEQGVQ